MRFRLLRPGPYSSALARLIAAAFDDDAFILVLGEHDGSRLQLLARVAAEVANLRCRVVRASTKPPEELSLESLLRQLADQAVSGDGTGDLLERSHRVLTEVDAKWDRVLLLIDHGDRLSPSALRFLQLTSRSGPKLRVVLASTPRGAAHPSAPEFKLLSARSLTISLGPLAAPSAGRLPGGPPPSGGRDTAVYAESSGPSVGGRDTAMFAEANGPTGRGRDTALYAEENGPSPNGRDTALFAEANGPSPNGRDTAIA